MEEISRNVFRVAALARKIIEESSASMQHPLGSFPHGWCDDCSRVLGSLLKEQNEANFKRVTGWRGEHLGASHVWLQRGDLIVDITADQFIGEVTTPVIVTTEIAWHSKWINQSFDDIEPIDFTRVEGRLYDFIKQSGSWPP